MTQQLLDKRLGSGCVDDSERDGIWFIKGNRFKAGMHVCQDVDVEQGKAVSLAAIMRAPAVSCHKIMSQ